MSIPLIDLSKFQISNQVSQKTLVKQIYQAGHEIGFMYLENPGISTDLLEQVFCLSKSFFDSPLAVKQQLAWRDEFRNTGYVGLERERLNPNQPGDLKEAFNLGNQELINRSLSSLSLAKNSVILAFYHACTELANTVLQALALALELPEDFFTTRHNQQNHTLRLLHYGPACAFEQKPTVSPETLVL